MRQQNFLIALFNKELLDLRAPVPRRWLTEQGKGRTLTRALEWNLHFCLMEYLFDRRGQVRKVFLKSKNRATLIDGCVKCHNLTALANGGVKVETTFHLYGYLKRNLCAFHRGVLAHVFVLPVFRSTYISSRHGVIFTVKVGILQESIFNQRPRIYALCSVEVSGVQ
jgi:Autophagy protein ATG9